jgi:D-alanyl-D-alanine carboxypeptidase
VEWFADKFFPRQIEELRIPGLTFVVVQDGEILLAKGYGLPSLEKAIPMGPKDTVTRTGSVSKLFRGHSGHAACEAR